MIWRAAAMVSLLASPATAKAPVSLSASSCPFSAKDVPKAYDATCFKMAWSEDAVAYRTLVAVVSHKDPAVLNDPVIYIPGGPGDAPVNKGADLASILDLFPQRTIVTLNPRGVKGAEPRPKCQFGADFWDQDIAPARENEITTQCRDTIDLDLEKFDAPYLAQDIDNLVRALKIERAGLFAISYGTESALHLLSRQPDWLTSVVLDSVSMPGALGTQERLAARDRFLGAVDRLCFSERQCPSDIVDSYGDLLGWVAQFDERPLELEVGPHKRMWSLDGQDMLDFLASLTSYPDGAGYAPLFIEVLETSRKETGEWVASELKSSINYALNNFVLLYGAFSDSAERDDPVPKAGSTRYPYDLEDQSALARLFKAWNRDGRTEPRFINPSTIRQPAGVPVLALSGGVDNLTPLSWAIEIGERFSGIKHFVFPDLGHAVAFGTDSDVSDKSVAHQLRCGPRVVRAFNAGQSYGDCAQFLRKKNP